MDKDKEKPGFYVWFKAYDQMDELTFEEKGKIFAAAADFARFGIVPSFEDRLLRSIWKRFQDELSNDDEKYRYNTSRQQEKGWIRTFKQIYAPQNGIDPEDKKALAAYLEERRSTVVDGSGQMTTNINSSSNFSTISNTTSTSTSTPTSDNIIKADKPPHNRFFPPSVDEVREYCKERGNSVDPERFVDYYTANGWMVGKSKMKDWKAAVRTWENNQFDNGRGDTKHGSSAGLNSDGWNLTKEIRL